MIASKPLAPRILVWMLVLPVLAWIGNALYALGAPGGWVKEYSPALVAAAFVTYLALHGGVRYGRWVMVRMVTIVFAIGWGAEQLSVKTGFPFGNYHYTEQMAPFVGHVPVFVLIAYALMGYASWSLACLLLSKRAVRLDVGAFLTIPILAALCMVVWDLSMDPLRATVEQRWVWAKSGLHLGVPLSNYLGWFLVTWLMFQSFALSLLARSNVDPRPQPPEWQYWLSIPLMYSAFAGEYLLNPFNGAVAASGIVVGSSEIQLQALYVQVSTLCLVTMVPLAMLGVRSALRSHSGAKG